MTITGTNRAVPVFLPWIIADACLSAVSLLRHLRLALLVAFLALFTSILVFVFTYRAAAAGEAPAIKNRARVAAWTTFVAAALYFVSWRWPS